MMVMSCPFAVARRREHDVCCVRRQPRTRAPLLCAFALQKFPPTVFIAKQKRSQPSRVAQRVLLCTSEK